MTAAARNTDLESRDIAQSDTLDFHASAPQAARCFMATEYMALRRFKFIHEMACGDGALVLPLRAAGYNVIASDIVDRGCPDSHVQDFLAPGFGPSDAAQRRRIAGFTNPPFNRACEFIVKGCAQYDYLAMVLRFRFRAAKQLVTPEGVKDLAHGKPLWRTTRIPLARMIVPKARWPMMHRDGYAGPRTDSSTIDFAIFVWEAGHSGPPLIIDEPDDRYSQEQQS